MEDLNLPASLILVWDLKRAIEKNQSIQLGIKLFISRGLKCKFALSFGEFWRQYQVGPVQPADILLSHLRFNSAQRALMFVVIKGLSGQSVYENLKLLEVEYIVYCEDEIQRHVQKLPLLLQIPLLGLIFPAIMSLFIVPALGILQF